VSEVDDVARQLGRVLRVETELRALLDDILAGRRALDRSKLGQLDVLLHGRARQALDVFDDLASTDVRVLLAAMPHVTPAAA